MVLWLGPLQMLAGTCPSSLHCSSLLISSSSSLSFRRPVLPSPAFSRRRSPMPARPPGTRITTPHPYSDLSAIFISFCLSLIRRRPSSTARLALSSADCSRGRFTISSRASSKHSHTRSLKSLCSWWPFFLKE